MNRTILIVFGLVLLTASVVVAQPRPPDGAQPRPPDGVQPRPPEGMQPQPPEGMQPRPPEGMQPRPPDGKPPRPPEGKQPRPPDPMTENSFPPELVMRRGEEIGLTPEQRESIMSEVQKSQGRFKELEPQMQQETQAMATLLKEEHPDLEKALGQLDKILNVERELKRTHMALLVAIKNKLTAEQQAQLQEFKRKMGPERRPGPGDGPPPPESLRTKMPQLKAGLRQWQDAGRDTAPVIEVMRDFDPLMKERKFVEAEAVLDRALGILAAEENK